MMLSKEKKRNPSSSYNLSKRYQRNEKTRTNHKLDSKRTGSSLPLRFHFRYMMTLLMMTGSKERKKMIEVLNGKMMMKMARKVGRGEVVVRDGWGN